MIKNIIEIELGFINTSHPDFVIDLVENNLEEEESEINQN